VQVEDAEESLDQEAPPVLVAKGLLTPKTPGQLHYSAPTMDGDGGVEVHDEGMVAEAMPAAGGDAGGGREADGEPADQTRSPSGGGRRTQPSGGTRAQRRSGKKRNRG
jgi:preprotein translocase subunit SecA